MRLYSLIVFISISVSTFAQERLRLEDAIATALNANLEIKLVKNSVESSKIMNSYGYAGGLPSINAVANDVEQYTALNQELSNGTSLSKTGVQANNLNAGITASLVLFNGLRISATKNRLAVLQKQSEQALNAQIQNTVAAVMTTYYDIVRQQSYLQTLQESIKVSEKRLELLQVRKQVGLANNAAIFQAQIDLNGLIQAFRNQELVVKVEKANLLSLLNRPADDTINIQDSIVVDEKIQMDSILNGLEANPDIEAANNQIRINELTTKETSAQRYPSLRLNGGYNYNRNQSDAGFTLLNQTNGPFIGASLAIPIYNGSALHKQQQVAKINVKNAEITRDVLLRDYTAGIIKTYEAYRTTVSSLKTEQENYQLAKQLLNLVFQCFELKQATILEVREAQKSFEDAGYRLVNISYAGKSAEIELKRVASLLVN